jgi:hypothetical protein
MHPIWFLQWLFPSGHWETAANVATTLGVAFAIIGAILAYKSYASASKIADNQHMHGIFKDYLRLRYDFEIYRLEKGLANNSPKLKSLLYDVVASRLYAAEEMWLWVRRLEKKRDKHSRSWWRRLKNRVFRWLKWRPDRHDLALRIEVDSWLATVVSHVIGEEPPAVTAKVLKNYIRCYSVDFLQFVAPYLEDAELIAAVALQNKAAEAGLPRPAGVAETSLTVLTTGKGLRRINGRDAWPPEKGDVVPGHREHPDYKPRSGWFRRWKTDAI